MCAMTGDLLSGLVGIEKKGILIYITCMFALTSDLLSGLVGREKKGIYYVCSDGRLAFGSCRQRKEGYINLYCVFSYRRLNHKPYVHPVVSRAQIILQRRHVAPFL